MARITSRAWQEEAREEIEDLATEHEREREELLNSIRNQNKELQLWEQVCKSAMICPNKLTDSSFQVTFSLIPSRLYR